MCTIGAYNYHGLGVPDYSHSIMGPKPYSNHYGPCLPYQFVLEAFWFEFGVQDSSAVSARVDTSERRSLRLHCAGASKCDEAEAT